MQAKVKRCSLSLFFHGDGKERKTHLWREDSTKKVENDLSEETAYEHGSHHCRPFVAHGADSAHDGGRAHHARRDGAHRLGKSQTLAKINGSRLDSVKEKKRLET
jgi:hypothetical protein